MHFSLYVTPFVGVWIETDNEIVNLQQNYVTPFVGVWIETDMQEDERQTH